MAEEQDILRVHLDSQDPFDEDDRELGYLLEMDPDRGWDLWHLVDGKKDHLVLAEQKPIECFNRMLDLPVDIAIYELEESGAICEVAYQDWDSGGPGAGAGRVSVYRLGDRRVGFVYFISHDAGFSDGYDDLKKACEDGWIDR
ncbi:hypothetical protein [Thioalkalivibrio sp. ALJ1]|uniref:hypothetical protein n=1 Tax=Thioalkalivibrio sp. ALJ1 TaxID=1158144 RepID=UPI00056FFBCF|nr:hypothetical protein [Thioalkalivibrio sp. ALJ1]